MDGGKNACELPFRQRPKGSGFRYQWVMELLPAGMGKATDGYVAAYSWVVIRRL